VAGLVAALQARLACARLRVDGGAALPCTTPPVPACAGSGVDDVLALVSGDGPTAAPPAGAVRAAVRCQRAVVSATSRYAGRRLVELARGVRPARRASVFATVKKACDGVAPAIEQGVTIPSLGAPCTASATALAGGLDGTQMARCARAGVERVLGAMTRPVTPNVVVVMTDDQNLASIAWMDRVQQWRSHAIDFRNGFVSTPVCAPSRATFLTSVYAQRHGVVSNFLAAPNLDASSTLATWLHDGGYVTALVGKYLNYEHLLDAVPPGWDEWQALSLDEGGDGFTDYGIDENGTRVRYGGTPREYSTDLLAARALDFVRANVNAPFFLLFTPYAPHLPAVPAPRHAGTLKLEPPWRPENWHEPDVSTKPAWVRFMKVTWSAEDTVRDDDARIRQLESLQAVDEAFGRLEDLLEKTGLLDNTVLVFTSDHGYHWGEHWWNSKFTEYEESLRVPLVVSYPARAPEPALRDEIVTNVDLAPTIAALAGVTPPSGRDGIDVSALLDGPGTTRDDFLIRNWGAIIVPSWSGVHEARLKYVSLESSGGVLEELYDVVADPMELSNLAASPAYAADLQRLRQRLAELRGP
jgi:arylsulfatase A-like enzyme